MGFLRFHIYFIPALFASIVFGKNPGSQITSSYPDTTLTTKKYIMPELKKIKVRQTRLKTPVHRQAGAVKLNRADLKNMASCVGDPIRSAASLPGVTIQSDFNASPVIRGGRPKETGVFLNGIRLIQPYHFGSVFSIVNQESIEDLKLYTSQFPSHVGDVLSGAILLKTRPPNQSRAELNLDISLLKGNGYFAVPLLKNIFSVNLSYHNLWYEHTAKALLNVLAGDSAFEAEMHEYRKYVNLPNHRDMQFGALLQLGGNAQIKYTGLSARDKIHITLPSKHNIFVKRLIPVATELEIMSEKPLRQAEKVGLDSLSFVFLNNQIHTLEFPWQVTPEFSLSLKAGAQWQAWDVAFSNTEAGGRPTQAAKWYQGLSPSNFRLDRLENRYDVSLASRLYSYQKHIINIGFDASYEYSRFHSQLPLPLYNMVTENNINVLESIGLYKAEGFTIARDNPETNSTDILGELAKRIQFNHDGWAESHNGAIFFQDDFEISNRISIQSGLRVNYQLQSEEIMPDPKFRFLYTLSPAWQAGFESGLFSNDLHPFYLNKKESKLKSEKSIQAGLEIIKSINNFQLELRPYGKYNYNLVTSNLVPAGRLNLSSLFIPHPNLDYSPQDIEDLKLVLEGSPNSAALSDSARNMAEALFGDYFLTYTNAGKGYTAGAELIFSYAKGNRWTGWLSLDYSQAMRNDGDGTAFYNAPHHRPWSVNWINTVQLPGKYIFSLKLRHAAGYAYTPYTGTLNDGGNNPNPVIVGKRNSARYAPYSRVDLKLIKTAQLAGQKFRTYFEVWNVFNSPNYFMRDSKTGELKFPDLNLPFPFLFFGIEYEL